MFIVLILLIRILIKTLIMFPLVLNLIFIQKNNWGLDKKQNRRQSRQKYNSVPHKKIFS